MAPHRYPFELIDPPLRPTAPDLAEREIAVRLTANAALLRGEGPLSLFLLLEIAAQATLHLAGGAAEGASTERVLLAGVEEMSFAEGAELNPPRAGDTLVLRARQEAAFAKVVKLRVEIDRDGRRLAAAVLLLATT